MATDGVEMGLSPEFTPTSDTASVELAVLGMHCRSCALLIEETLLAEPGVHEATVDLDGARAAVSFGPSMTSVEALCAAVAGAGYQATPLASGDQVP
jgi:copper chaperone CopZ